MRLFFILLALFLPSAALAQNQVALTSEIFVERTVTDANGAARVSLEAPGVVTPAIICFRVELPEQRRRPCERFRRFEPIPDFGRLRRHRKPRRGLFRRRRQELGGARRAHDPRRRRQQPVRDLADVTGVQWRFAQAIAPGSADN